MHSSKIIDIIAGARPNFMKIAPIIDAIEKSKKKGSCLEYRLIHTGQHYDEKMSGDFFRQLSIPQPHFNLGAGSGTQAEQTASIMIGYEKLLFHSPSDMCLVVGDVNSTVACAIVSQKQCIPVAHVEGGIRSGDWKMPEEINRILTDSISNWFFTTSEYANKNLRSIGISDDHIFFVGNTMIDTLFKNLPKIEKPIFFDELSLTPQKFIVLTLHRPSNVDNKDDLESILKSLVKMSAGLPIIFPAHPRTMQVLKKINNFPSQVVVVDPQPYFQFIYLVKHAKVIVTDSGGISEETTMMSIPCITLRDSTERPETVSMGTNQLVGRDSKMLEKALGKILAGELKLNQFPPLWDGMTSERIIKCLEKILCQ
jgi:UDP-N-acetylglucosamine 2-epimerase (non-hydrolysing)